MARLIMRLQLLSILAAILTGGWYVLTLPASGQLVVNLPGVAFALATLAVALSVLAGGVELVAGMGDDDGEHL